MQTLINLKQPSRRQLIEGLYNNRRLLILKQARESLWSYCQLRAPDFYTVDRKYLWEYCRALQTLYEGKLINGNGKNYTKLMINMPPQFGKSRTLQLFCEWAIGRNPAERIILASYNDIISGEFSKYVRDGIDEQKNLPSDIVFSDIFPGVRLQRGSESKHRWTVEGQPFTYIGAGVGGTITGKGATIRIIDDPVKNAEIAYNDDALDKIWKWRTGTFLSRKTGRVIDIINMTRWSKKDPCGRILASERACEWYQLKFVAKTGDTMLCTDILNVNEYEELSDPEVGMEKALFRANYHQEPLDFTGKLYTSFKTYKDYPKDEDGNPVFERIIAYVDTADEGSDYLCALIAGVYLGEAWLLDVYLTKDGMEITEPESAAFLNRNNVSLARIESNNGGRGFARAITRIFRENIQKETERINDKDDPFTEEDRKWSLCPVKWFHQTENKRARIMSNSAFVQNHIYMPEGWEQRWPRFYKELSGYMKEGKNKYDDPEDALTGLCEMVGKGRPRARMIA